MPKVAYVMCEWSPKVTHSVQGPDLRGDVRWHVGIHCEDLPDERSLGQLRCRRRQLAEDPSFKQVPAARLRFNKVLRQLDDLWSRPFAYFVTI